MHCFLACFFFLLTLISHGDILLNTLGSLLENNSVGTSSGPWESISYLQGETFFLVMCATYELQKYFSFKFVIIFGKHCVFYRSFQCRWRTQKIPWQTINHFYFIHILPDKNLSSIWRIRKSLRQGGIIPTEGILKRKSRLQKKTKTKVIWIILYWSSQNF